MAKQSPHKSWKGCAMCKPHKHKGCGQAEQTPWAVLRRLGKKRRLGRHDVAW